MSTITTVIADLFGPRAISPTTDGAFLVTEGHGILPEGGGPPGGGPAGNRFALWVVLRVSSDGTATIVAGRQEEGVDVGGGGQGDDGVATEALFDDIAGVAATGDGGFLVAETASHAVRKVSPDGVITRVAGNYRDPGSTGEGSAHGDDGDATAATLGAPIGLAPLGDNGFVLAESASHTIRRVGGSGTITRLAGAYYQPGFRGDDGRATGARLNTPTGLAARPDGGLLVADTGNHVIREISAAGIITTVAGTPGVAGSGGDDGLATHCQLDSPSGIAPTADGGFLIADTGNHVVRAVSPTGVITRIAGQVGVAGDQGDGGPPTDALLSNPAGVAVLADGSILIADTGNGAVRRIQ